MSIDILKQLAPIPDLLSYQSYLFVGPHPDDIEIGAGGTISKLISLGKKVYFLVVTDGGCGSSDAFQDINHLIGTRLEEMKNAAQLLGVSELFDLGLPDGGPYSEYEASLKIAKVILDTNPDVVICPDPLQPAEIHPDHLKTGNAVNQAILMTGYPLIAKRNQIDFTTDMIPHFRGRVLGYYFTHRPNIMISLSEKDVDNRMKSIQSHQSQFKTPESLEMILSYLAVRSLILTKTQDNTLTEGFFVYGSLHQHCFPEILEY